MNLHPFSKVPALSDGDTFARTYIRRGRKSHMRPSIDQSIHQGINSYIDEENGRLGG